MRHGRPKTVSIRVAEEEGGRIANTVRDDGSGLARNGTRGGFGIRGMRERVALLGGELEVREAGGVRGALVEAWLPAAYEGAASA